MNRKGNSENGIQSDELFNPDGVDNKPESGKYTNPVVRKFRVPNLSVYLLVKRRGK